MNYSAPELVQIDAAGARALTDQIKVAVEATWELVKRAYMERAWAALGYDGWDDYCTREFGTSRLRLPREERTEVVASLRESGLSVRAIASATGLARNTVRGSLRDQVGQIDPPATDPQPVIGTDGKTYSPRQQTTCTDDSGDEVGGIVDDRDPDTISDQDWIDAAYDADALNEAADEYEADLPEPEPEPVKPRRRPLEEGFFDATTRLNRAVTSLENLGNDDRLPRNKEKVARYRADLLRAIDALQCVADQLNH